VKEKNQTVHEMRLGWLKQFKHMDRTYTNILAETQSEEEERHFVECHERTKERLLSLILGLSILDSSSPDYLLFNKKGE
jgi:hypothetical protein